MHSVLDHGRELASEVVLVKVRLHLKDADGHVVLDLGQVLLEDLLVHLVDLLGRLDLHVHALRLQLGNLVGLLLGEGVSKRPDLVFVELTELLQVLVEDVLVDLAVQNELRVRHALSLVGDLDEQVVVDAVGSHLSEGLTELLDLAGNGLHGELLDLNLQLGSTGVVRVQAERGVAIEDSILIVERVLADSELRLNVEAGNAKVVVAHRSGRLILVVSSVVTAFLLLAAKSKESVGGHGKCECKNGNR